MATKKTTPKKSSSAAPKMTLEQYVEQLANKFLHELESSQLDRIEAKVDELIDRAKTTHSLQTLDHDHIVLGIIPKLELIMSQPTVEQAAPQPEGLKPGDYTDASKEVADALTSMGWGWVDEHRSSYKYVRWCHDLARKPMNNTARAGYSLDFYHHPAEFLARAAVTAKALGMVPVVEKWVPAIGQWIKFKDGSWQAEAYNGIAKVKSGPDEDGDYLTEGVSADLLVYYFAVDEARPATDAEVQQHIAEQEARANAEKLAKLKFGDKVQWKMGGAGLCDFRVACNGLSKGGQVKILDANSYAADPFWALLSDITVIDPQP